jgi:hypothetical protein
MNVFIGMEESQVIQRAFEERGHNAWSCDLKPGRLNPSRHIQSVGIMSTRWRRPDQIIQPSWFGDNASKSTCLWLRELPPLLPTTYFPPRMVNGRPRWGNQTDSGQNRLGPTKDPEDRRAARAVTYPGPAAAMAEQWGTL